MLALCAESLENRQARSRAATIKLTHYPVAGAIDSRSRSVLNHTMAEWGPAVADELRRDVRFETPPVATKPSASRKVTAEFRLKSDPADRPCGRFCSP